jgi:hypothetical protein
MSLSSPMPSAGRPLQEQALALVAFLAARDNVLTAPQATSALDGLPDDPKPAAKELRGRLKALGVDIQHTHALKAVAEARGGSGYLGLGEQLQYDVASWSPDAAGISCERVRLASFAAAADEVCKRIRENYEDDPPFGALRVEKDEFLFIGTSAATGSLWKVLLAPAHPDGKEGTFRQAGPLERLAERLRRLVDGQLGGWLDGTYEVGKAVTANDEPALNAKPRTDALFADQLILEPVEPLPSQPPNSIPAEVPWSPRARLTPAQWDDFRKRYDFFARRHSETSLSEWVHELLTAASVPRFEAVPINLSLLERALAAAKVTWADLSFEFPLDDDGKHVADLKAGRGCLDAIHVVSAELGLDPNELMVQACATPRIPLPHHTELALWLSRMDAVVSQPEGAPAVAAGLVNRLKALCAVPYKKRRGWGDRPPAELEALNQEIRFAGLMVCAGMGTRFVQDLPNGRTRPASLLVLELDWQVDVLTQGGQLDPENALMSIGPERDPVTPEWLARFNKPRFTASDLLRYSDMVHETIGEEDDEKDRFTAKVFAGIKVFNRDPEKAHSASVRMEALSRLIKKEAMEPWVRRSRDTEEGSLMIAEAAFEATASCELVDIDGEPGFDRQTFYMLCVKHSRKYS